MMDERYTEGYNEESKESQEAGQQAGAAGYMDYTEAGSAVPEKKLKKAKKSKKAPKGPMSMKKRWAVLVAMALVFGAVAGGTAFGVNVAASQVYNRKAAENGISNTETVSVTSGYVSALDRNLQISSDNGTTNTYTGLIQTDAPINSGNSGGALLNMKGELIGINQAKSSTTQSGTTVDGIGFAIPINKAQESLQNLMNQTTREKVDESQASYLGIQGTDVSSEASQMYGMPTGVAVSAVVEDGPAAQAGMLAGDIITGFDGRTITGMSQLQDVLQYYAAGETVEVTVQRTDQGEYKEQTVSVTLGSASDAQTEIMQK